MRIYSGGVANDDAITDEELTLLALDADPAAPMPEGTVAWREFFGEDDPNTLLPEWYMPAPSGVCRSGRTWKRMVAIVAIVAFLSINAVGLCSTYGFVELAGG